VSGAARRLRLALTDAERALWRGLRQRGLEQFRFRRQHPLHGFVVDFACLEAALVVEVDGATHSTEAEKAADLRREGVLKRHGFSLLRFSNPEVFENLEGVLETIRLKLVELKPEGPKRTSRFEKMEEREFVPGERRHGSAPALPSPASGGGDRKA
jgi:very-short-patch-repair endonuclease